MMSAPSRAGMSAWLRPFVGRWAGPDAMPNRQMSSIATGPILSVILAFPARSAANRLGYSVWQLFCVAELFA